MTEDSDAPPPIISLRFEASRNNFSLNSMPRFVWATGQRAISQNPYSPISKNVRSSHESVKHSFWEDSTIAWTWSRCGKRKGRKRWTRRTWTRVRRQRWLERIVQWNNKNLQAAERKPVSEKEKPNKSRKLMIRAQEETVKRFESNRQRNYLMETTIFHHRYEEFRCREHTTRTQNTTRKKNVPLPHARNNNDKLMRSINP